MSISTDRLRPILFWSYAVLFFVMSLVPFGTQVMNVPGKVFYYPALTLVMLLLSAGAYTLSPRPERLDKWLAFLCFFMAISLATSVDRPHSLKVFAGFFIKGPMAAFVAARIFTEKPRLAAGIFLGAAGVVTTIGFAEFLFQWNPYGSTLYTDRNIHFSTIGNPIPLGSYLTIFVPAAVALALETKARQRLFYASAAALIAAAALLTLSRSTWIALFVSTVVFFLNPAVRKHPAGKWPYAAIAGALTALILVVSIFILHGGAEEYFRNKFKRDMFVSSSVKYRVKTADEAYRIFRDHPLLGVGFGNYTRVHSQYKKADVLSITDTPNNMYLRLLCDMGIIGASAFFIFMVYWMSILFKWRAEPLVWGCFCGLVGFLINQTVDDLMLWQAPQFAFWTILGLGAATINLKARGGRPRL